MNRLQHYLSCAALAAVLAVSFPRSARAQDRAVPQGFDTAARSQPASGRVSAEEYLGWKQYELHCSRCHGESGIGSSFAPNLTVSVAGPLDQSGFVATVRDGRVERGMPSFQPILSEDQIVAIYAYLKGRADQRIPPGRPARPGG